MLSTPVAASTNSDLARNTVVMQLVFSDRVQVNNGVVVGIVEHIKIALQDAVEMSRISYESIEHHADDSNVERICRMLLCTGGA